MKNQFKYLFSNLLLVALTGSMFVVAGCPEDDACTTNDDCTVEGETCNTETSVCEGPAEGCTADTDCSATQSCNDAGVCIDDCTKQAEGFCEAASAGQVCDADTKTCITPAGPTDEYRYVLIKDVSSGASACASNPAAGGSDPGSDIMWSRLSNATNEVIGFAKFVSITEGTTDKDPNTYNKGATVLTGMALSIDADLCPAEDGDGKRFRDDSVVALGCGGSLFIEYIGNAGTAVTIANGYDVEVGEYAAFCNQAGGDPMGSDRYDVYLCKTQVGTLPTNADCTIKLNAAAQGGILAPVTVSGL